MSLGRLIWQRWANDRWTASFKSENLSLEWTPAGAGRRKSVPPGAEAPAALRLLRQEILYDDSVPNGKLVEELGKARQQQRDNFCPALKGTPVLVFCLHQRPYIQS